VHVRIFRYSVFSRSIFKALVGGSSKLGSFPVTAVDFLPFFDLSRKRSLIQRTGSESCFAFANLASCKLPRLLPRASADGLKISGV
jgi:hypothetical protein